MAYLSFTAGVSPSTALVTAMNGKRVVTQVQALHLVYSVDEMTKDGVIRVFGGNPVGLLRQYPCERLLAAMSPGVFALKPEQLNEAYQAAITHWSFRSIN